MSFAFTSEQLEKIEKICGRYPARRSAMLPVLWMVQRQEGWVSPEAEEAVAAILQVTPAAVHEVVTFYSMFERTPGARHHIQVCRTIGCWLRGAGSLCKYLENKLEIKPGEQSPDGRFKLSQVECLASCGSGPMMQIDDDYYENLTPAKVDAILGRLK